LRPILRTPRRRPKRPRVIVIPKTIAAAMANLLCSPPRIKSQPIRESPS
jgi:hypothetical protein